MEPFAPRRIACVGLREPASWKLKLYSVVYGREPVDWAGFEPGLQLAEQAMPKPDPTAGRPGLGFIIAHQGRTGDYVVLCWWEAENELPIRVWVRRSRQESFRPGEGGESVCVWDLEVIWSERQAWVETMLAPGGSDPAAYLARRYRAS